jgi:NCS1 family nucleobase:cation symporter-1
MQTVQPAIPLRTSIAKLYNLAFVLGFAIAFLVHLGLNLIFPPPSLGEIDDTDIFHTFTDDEARTLGLHAHSPTDSEIIEERVNREELKIA